MKEKGKEAVLQDDRNRGMGDVILPLLVYYLVYLSAAVILTQIVTYIRIKAGSSLQAFLTEQETTVGAVLGGIAMLLGMLPLLPGFRRELVLHKRATGEKSIFCTRAVFTVVLALTSSIALNILFSQLHLLEKSESYTQVAESQYGVWFPAGLFLYGVVSPLAEEIVFRGVIYNRIKRHFSVKFSVILSALLFGIYHGNLIQGIYGFVIGILIAYAYERFGSFFFAFLFHAAANAAVYTITGNESLYRLVMRPISGIVCVIIAGVALLLMRTDHC